MTKANFWENSFLPQDAKMGKNQGFLSFCKSFVIIFSGFSKWKFMVL